MKGFRQVVFWAHLVTGVVCGAVVLTMSVTGALLTYQKEMQAWADRRGMDAGPPTAAAAPLPTAELIARASAGRGVPATAVTRRADPEAPASVAFGPEGSWYVNAYTGEVLGQGSLAVREFFTKVVAWHRWLGVTDPERRALPKSITGATNLGFLFIVVSGLFLWWPRTWTAQAVANVTRFRRGLSPKARDFNWHNTIGFWSAIPLAIVVASATVISYPWASNLAYRVMGDEPPRPAAPGASAAATPAAAAPAPSHEGLDVLFARAAEQDPEWRSIALTLPKPGAEEVVFAIDAGDGGAPQKRSTLALAAATGEVARWEPFSSQTPGRRFRTILRFAHTGEVLGLFGQTIAGIVSAGGAVLVWTGISLALRRLWAWRRRRERLGDEPGAEERLAA